MNFATLGSTGLLLWIPAIDIEVRPDGLMVFDINEL
jgi:hypothetical protein